jgi:hypothetical protein
LDDRYEDTDGAGPNFAETVAVPVPIFDELGHGTILFSVYSLSSVRGTEKFGEPFPTQ